MGEIKKSPKVKLFCGVLFAKAEWWNDIVNILAENFGEIDFESKLINFAFTKYYEDEIGKMVFRKFVTFKDLKSSDILADVKIKTNQLEELFFDKDGFKRPVNIDPGYIESSKLILASTKNFFHRIYIGKGIFAEITTHYSAKQWQFFQWTYPDYQSDEYLDFFSIVRKNYLKQLDEEK